MVRAGRGPGGSRGKAMRMAGFALAFMVIALTFAFGVHLATSEPDASIDAPAEEDAGAEPASEWEYSAGSRFHGIATWAFLSSEETSGNLADGIYTLLVREGMADDSHVYVIGSWESTAEGYRGWVHTSPEDLYWAVDITVPGFTPSITEADVTSIPGLEDDVAEDSPLSSLDEAVEQPALGEEPKVNDYRDLSAGVSISDVAGLSALMPSQAASTAEEVLIPGVKSQFGFAADPVLSKVYPESVTVSGQSCRFTAAFVDGSQNVLTLAITFDGATGNFTGEKIEI